MLDGTWKQAHEMLRTVESLGRCVRLADDSLAEPSRYWLRDQPGPSQLSTAEALTAVFGSIGDGDAARLLRLHFELHVYATLLSRGKREMAERYLGDSPLRSEAPDVLDHLHARWLTVR
jgi:DTW domain-containing protein YfiP